jgi:hypothetical protein
MLEIHLKAISWCHGNGGTVGEIRLAINSSLLNVNIEFSHDSKKYSKEFSRLKC